MWVNIPFMDPTGFQQKSSNQRSHNSYIGRPNDPCFHSKSQLHNSLEFIKIQSSQTTCIHFIYHLKHTADFGVLSGSCIFCHPKKKKNLKLIKITKKIFRVFHETSSNFPHQQLSEMLQKSRPDLRASSKTWDIGSILRFISKSANSELSTTPLPFCAASNGRMPEPGVGVAKWNQNHPVVFLEKKKAKMENKYVEICKDPRHFSSTQKKICLFLHFWKNTGITSPKKKLKSTLFLRYYLFFS